MLSAGKDIFRHLEQQRINAWIRERKNERELLLPSSAINLLMKDEEEMIDMLNPSPEDLFVGLHVTQLDGQGSRKKILRRRLDMMSGAYAAHSGVMNGKKQVKQIRDYLSINAAVHEVKESKKKAAMAKKQ